MLFGNSATLFFSVMLFCSLLAVYLLNPTHKELMEIRDTQAIALLERLRYYKIEDEKVILAMSAESALRFQDRDEAYGAKIERSETLLERATASKIIYRNKKIYLKDGATYERANTMQATIDHGIYDTVDAEFHTDGRFTIDSQSYSASGRGVSYDHKRSNIEAKDINIKYRP